MVYGVGEVVRCPDRVLERGLIRDQHSCVAARLLAVSPDEWQGTMASNFGLAKSAGQ